MTVASASSPPMTTKEPAVIARKRRRRTPAGGASDDCFTCTKRSVKCDRRRPYCSQCLEIGNECSGYKTQLTWNVGVASRGKLRGLSLPVAKSAPVHPNSNSVAKKASPSRTRASSTTIGNTQWPETVEEQRQHQHSPIPHSPLPLQHHQQQPTSHPMGVDDMTAHSQPTTPFAAYDIPLPMSGETTPSMPQGQWTSSMPFPSKLATHLSHISTSGALSPSVDSLSDVEYMSPMSHSFPRDDMPFMTSPAIMYESYTSHSSPVPQSPVSNVMLEHRTIAPTSCPSLVYAPSEPGSSIGTNVEGFDSHLAPKVMSDCGPLGVPDLDTTNYSSSYQSTGPAWPATFEEEQTARSYDHSPGPWPSTSEPPPPQTIQVNQDLIAKMPFFMDYYKNTMCPNMVFIDGPGNPYREHILQLAQSSQSLRHAICALSACNLRMRRKLSLGHHRTSSTSSETNGNKFQPKTTSETIQDAAQPEDQSLSEELQHRNLAVHLLNQQLNDPSKSADDSVLATILLLCHYRMVESGIAKFHTQFAGVKKILAMGRSGQGQGRGPYQGHTSQSRDSAAWLEAIFTYFDAISASINDRETQLNTSFYGVMPDSHLLPPGAENLVGCDRELFKTVGKLGRLNLLSQQRPVQNVPARGIPSRSQTESPVGTPSLHPGDQSQSSSHPEIFTPPINVPRHNSPGTHNSRYDGNGFGTLLDNDTILHSNLSSPPTYEDTRSTFWREWKDARLALQTWDFTPQTLHLTLPSASTSQIRDLGSLSEAFRYAALLYTERLASPSASSTNPNFQNLVSQVVFYATSLEAGSQAEKFLLWPLFVAGSECVSELQRDIVRRKCREIMGRSGYMNNLAALELLEKVWAGELATQDAGYSGGLGGGAGQYKCGPFSWMRCIGGQGVEVEWIMF